MEDLYGTLNLQPNASPEDIKASYRRLAKKYHPDAAGPQGDALLFTKIHEAYIQLLRSLDDQKAAPGLKVEEVKGHTHRPRETRTPQPKGVAWRFEGVAEDGLNVVYVLKISPAAAVSGLNLILPWQAEEACPSCFGQGYSMQPMFGGPHLLKSPCLKCQTKGVVKHNSTVRVQLTPETISRGTTVMKGLGHYQPRSGRRGDLVVEVQVDRNSGRSGSGMYSA